jgi:cytochrome c-type biogenesis protein CcmI
VTYLILGAVILCLVGISFVLIPWYFSRSRTQQDTLTNTQLIRQRLIEIEDDRVHGLLSEEDKIQAEEELKLALLDEVGQVEEQNASARMPMLIGALVTIGVGITIYFQANQVDHLEHWNESVQRLPELGKRIVMEADATITADDLETFALGIRTKLRKDANDVTGWLLLGRLHGSLNRLDSAIEAYKIAYALDPEHRGVLSSYSQALVLTGEESYMRQGLVLLQRLLVLEPNDNNTIGMLAVTASQLGDTELALKTWKTLKARLSPDDPMQLEINRRISTLDGTATASAGIETAKNATSVMINITLSEELTEKIPQDGFLFVFAQDASGAVRMPAAVVKSRLSQLPIQVELSDANAMMPTYKLSQLSEVRLVARISADENVAESQGELQGEVKVTLQQGVQINQDITIDTELL